MAANYLQSIASKEGYTIAFRDAAALYDSTVHADASYDDLTWPITSQTEPCPNIREAVNNLQLFCQTTEKKFFVVFEVFSPRSNIATETNCIQHSADSYESASKRQMRVLECHADIRSIVDTNAINSLFIELKVFDIS